MCGVCVCVCVERNRKRPPPAVRGAAGEKRRRDALVPQPLLQEELEQDEDSCTSGIDLPSIDLPSTPGQPLHGIYMYIILCTYLSWYIHVYMYISVNMIM